MAKKTLFWFLKACVSGLVALSILTGLCMVYYNVPVHYSTKDGATDYSWEKNKFYSRGTEGFAWGKTNNEGYLNSFDYTEDTEVDVLIMGSSHMEAYQVAMDQSAAAVLGKLMPEKTVYNIGTSGHHLIVCADNLSSALTKYKPGDYVVIEVANLSFSEDQVQDAINEEVAELPSQSGGLIGLLQKIPFLRLVYLQLTSFANKGGADVDGENTGSSTAEVASSESYNALLERMNRTAEDAGVELIIVYHPSLYLNEDGSATVSYDNDLSSMFAEKCESNGITFLNMGERFIRGYAEDHVLPHGFANTSVGSGHLNKNGHAMIAESLYEIMKEAE